MDPRNSPLRGSPKGDERRSCDAGGFSLNVIPAKGEAREPGTICEPVRNFEMDPGSLTRPG